MFSRSAIRPSTSKILLLLAVCVLVAGTVAAETEEKTTEEKIAELEAAVTADPTNGKSWNDLGVLHAQEGRFDQARDAFIHAVQTSPQDRKSTRLNSSH